MKIAIPTADGVLCPHFGHCQHFTIVDVDPVTKRILAAEAKAPPPHEPGAYPKWLSELGCDVIIAGGMGGRAESMFRQNGVRVVVGAPNKTPEEVVMALLNLELDTGANPCDDPSFHGGESCGN
jgi:predicted Fe-Mo cluster-binding NifX family protein